MCTWCNVGFGQRRFAHLYSEPAHCEVFVSKWMRSLVNLTLPPPPPPPKSAPENTQIHTRKSMSQCSSAHRATGISGWWWVMLCRTLERRVTTETKARKRERAFAAHHHRTHSPGHIYTIIIDAGRFVTTLSLPPLRRNLWLGD